MTGAQRRQSNWTAEEDRLLLELVEAGKSWVFIAANLKRPAKSARRHLAYLRQPIRPELDGRPGEQAPKGEGEMKELRHFSARPWSQSDDDKLRPLAMAGERSRAIGLEMDRTESSVRSRAARLNIILRN
jgi:hypothetical protein